MIELILYSLVLLIFQIMAHYPLNLQHVQFFLSNRHGDIQYSEATLRIQRAAANLKETLPIFLTLMLLGLIQEVDLVSLGTYWLLLRVIFFGLYASFVPVKFGCGASCHLRRNESFSLLGISSV